MKSAGFICDALHWRGTQLTPLEKQKVKLFSDILLESYRFDLESNPASELSKAIMEPKLPVLANRTNVYEKNTKFKQDPLKNLTMYHYDFVKEVLSDSNKQWLQKNYNYLVEHGILDNNPLAMVLN